MIGTLRIAFRVFIPKRERRKWLGLLGLAFAVAAAETLTAVLIFRVLGQATDPTPSGQIDLAFGLSMTLVPLLILAGVAFVVRGGLALLNIYAQSKVVQSAGARISAEVHRRYLQAPYRFHLSRSSSESVRTVLWSVDQATNNALNPLVTLVTQGLMSLTLFGLLIAIAPALSLSAILVLGVGLGLVLTFVQPRLVKLGKLSEDTVKSLLASVRDSFDSVRDIKAYRAEGYFDRRFSRHRDVLAELRIRKAFFDQIPATTVEAIVVLGLLALIGVAQAGSFTDFVPVLGAFGYATLRIVPSLNKLVASVNRLKYGEQAVKNVENDLQSAIPEPEPELLDPSALFQDTIELAGISFSYPEAEIPALQGVDLVINRGEMLAIAGGSGSGKSTLVDVVLGLLEADGGDIRIDGSTSLPDGWHQKVGIVSQSVVLLDASVRENVSFGDSTDADDARVMAALERSRLMSWFDGLPNGLDTMVGESGKLLSGGERQRVAIARALYRNPDLLILDEATSALDGATEASLIEALQALAGELTIVVVSHRLAPIQAADRVVMMEGGKVAAVGTYAALVEDGTAFQDLVGL